MADDAPEMDGSDAQDIAEVFDEDNLDSDSARLARNDEELNFDDMPDVYDATTALGDSDEEDGPIGEELDDEEIVELSRQEADERDNREDANDYRASEAFDEDPEDRVGGEADVGLAYAGDLSQTPGAHSAAQRYESRTLSDSDVADLGYADAPDPLAQSAEQASASRTPDPGASGAAASAEEARSFQADAKAPAASAQDGRAQSRLDGEGSAQSATAKAQAAHEDDALDEGLKETFPASDPVAVKHIT